MGRVGNVAGSRTRRRCAMIALMLSVFLTAYFLACDLSYAELKTSRKWGKEITDAKLNKYNGKAYEWKLPGVDQYACTGYTEWALNSVYGIKVPGYASTRALREYFIKKGNKIVAYGSHVAKAQGGNGKYYSYGEIKPGDIVFFFRRGSNKSGKVTRSPIKASRGYTTVTGWRHVAIVGGSVSGSHGIKSKLHHNTQSAGIHYGGTIKERISIYSDAKGATDYQVMRVISPELIKRPVKIIKTMKVNGNELPEEKAVFRIWPKKYGKYSSKSSWWKKIPSEYKDQVTTDSKGTAVTAALPTASDDFNGKYYIHQTKGPGKVRLAKNQGITLKKGTSTVKWTYTDKSQEHPAIIKKDAVSGENVTQEGVVFRLKKKGAFQSLCEALGTGSQNEEEDSDENSEENEVFALESKLQDELPGEGDKLQEPEESGAEGSDGEETDAGSGEVSDDSGGEGTDEDAGDDEEDTSQGKSGLDLGKIEQIVGAFLSDDPEGELKKLGVEIPGAAWASIGGKSEFVTDESGEAEITTIGPGETGEYEVYEVKSPEGFKLPGYMIAAADPASASELDRPAEMELESLASTATVEVYDMPEPEIGTTAQDAATENHIGSSVENAGIVDTVSYENLEEGKAYTVFGTLMFKDTGEPVKDSSGKVVTGSTSFDAEDNSGSVQVEFSFDGRITAGHEVVVFERLYEGDFDEEPEAAEPLARHEDLTDEDQTVSFPEIPDEPDEPEEPDEPDEPEKPDVPGVDKPGPEPPDKVRTPGIPKTGDDQLELVLLLITVLVGAVVILAIMALTYRDKSQENARKRG